MEFDKIFSDLDCCTVFAQWDLYKNEVETKFLQEGIFSEQFRKFREFLVKNDCYATSKQIWP